MGSYKVNKNSCGIENNENIDLSLNRLIKLSLELK